MLVIYQNRRPALVAGISNLVGAYFSKSAGSTATPKRGGVAGVRVALFYFHLCT